MKDSRNRRKCFCASVLATALFFCLSSPQVLYSYTWVEGPIDTSHLIRAAHVTELRTAVNAKRVEYGFASFSGWTDATVDVSKLVRSAHVNELRDKIDDVTDVFNPICPAIVAAHQGWTNDPVVADVTPIRAIHFTELRGTVDGITGTGSQCCSAACKYANGASGCSNVGDGTDVRGDCPDAQCYTGTCTSGACAFQGSGSDTYGWCTTASCQTGNCNGTSNACGYVSAQTDPNNSCGTACQVCNGGASCVAATNGTDPTADCPDAQCYTGVCQGGACAFVADGVDTWGWCGTATCQDGFCAGGSNACGYVTAQTDPYNSCTACMVCNGGSGCVNATAGTDPAGDCDTASCRDGNCSAGACTYVAAQTDPNNSCGTACQVCNGGASCVAATNGTDPTADCPDAQCYTGVCQTGACAFQADGSDTYGWCGTATCQDGFCAGGSNACGYVTAQTDPYNSCTACMVCNGGASCVNATAGTDPAGDCDTASCRDGNCSGGACTYVAAQTDPNNSCVTACQVCNGGASCVAATNGTDPTADCPDSECRTGLCSGGACAFQADGSDTYGWCGTTSCQDGACAGGSNTCGYVAAQTDPNNNCASLCTVCNGGASCVNTTVGTDPVNDCPNAICKATTCDGSGACSNLADGSEGSEGGWGSNCSTCQDCISGSCANITASEDPGCTGVCTYCNAGTCTNRGADDQTEGCASTCFDCISGACSPVTAAFQDNGCTADSTACSWADTCDGAGNCLVNHKAYPTSCGTCYVCNGSDSCVSPSGEHDPNNDCGAYDGICIKSPMQRGYCTSSGDCVLADDQRCSGGVYAKCNPVGYNCPTSGCTTLGTYTSTFQPQCVNWPCSGTASYGVCPP